MNNAVIEQAGLALELNAFLEKINDPEMKAILKIQSQLLNALQKIIYRKQFLQLMPLLMSPITDPLNHSVYPAEISYEDQKFKLTASMIFHKQLALIPEYMNQIVIIAPNIRLELESEKSSQNHLLEFSQFDVEFKDYSMNQVMDFIEEVFLFVFQEINETCADELAKLGRVLPKLDKPFQRYSTVGLQKDKIDQFCDDLSRTEKQPFFITSFEREFYDREDPENLGQYFNFDLYYPESFGEALSGAEREYEYDSIVRKMKERNMDLEPYQNYLALAKKGLIPKTAGFGIGIQRLLKFVCGKKAINDVCLFDRTMQSDFIF